MIFYPDLQCNLDFIKAYTRIFETKPSQQLLMKYFSFGSGAQFIVSKEDGSNALIISQDPSKVDSIPTIRSNDEKTGTFLNKLFFLAIFCR